jgi:hypothetical protein
MNNLTIERVLNAYEAGVTNPGFHGWGDREKQCGCAMTAVVIHEKPEWFSTLEEVLDNYESIGSNEICEAADVTWAYMLGYTDAFDGLEYGTSDQEGNADVWEDIDKAQYGMGYDHGKAARAAVFDKYFPNGYELTAGEVPDQ